HSVPPLRGVIIQWACWEPLFPGLSVLCSTSTFHPGSCTGAPSSLDSSVDLQPHSTWVEHRHASAAGLQSVHFSSALHSFGLGKLCPPSGSTFTLGHTSSSIDRCLPSQHCGSSLLQLQHGLHLACQHVYSMAAASISSSMVSSACFNYLLVLLLSPNLPSMFFVTVK
ncbi:hypothetical protein M9458_002926, partial [Cirrhinus mrigala]